MATNKEVRLRQTREVDEVNGEKETKKKKELLGKVPKIRTCSYLWETNILQLAHRRLMDVFKTSVNDPFLSFNYYLIYWIIKIKIYYHGLNDYVEKQQVRIEKYILGQKSWNG